MTWLHKSELCDEHNCYCLGEDQPPDPMCDCGYPGYACDRAWHDDQEYMRQMELEEQRRDIVDAETDDWWTAWGMGDD